MCALFGCIFSSYLGSAETFRKKRRMPIALHDDAETAAALQKITAPFPLRRLKSDPAVISDLSKKVITLQYCCLIPLQTALYESRIMYLCSGETWIATMNNKGLSALFT